MWKSHHSGGRSSCSGLDECATINISAALLHSRAP
jgi:hypothetical protein